ncbi:MAG: radical SAM protein [Candidatus Bathyarchaeia archaeon]
MKANNIASRSVEAIRVSSGSAVVLGLARGLLKVRPTTVYLLTYREGRCTANCGFCAQARSSRSRVDLLSRVFWPPFPLKVVKKSVSSAYSDGIVERVCIQTLNYENVLEDVLHIVGELRSESEVPISVSCQPFRKESFESLSKSGVERVEISLDAATEELFERVKGSGVKGPYTWKRHLEAIRDAVEVFGRGRVTTHLIVGLGESEEEIVKTVQWCVDNGILPALFAFTPIPGTRLESLKQPAIESYRRIQFARYLIVNRVINYEDLRFNNKGEIECYPLTKNHMFELCTSGNPFMTSGCPGCNRPFYNERVRGPLYNLPSRELWEEVKEFELNRLKRVIRLCF